MHGLSNDWVINFNEIYRAMVCNGTKKNIARYYWTLSKIGISL